MHCCSVSVASIFTRRAVNLRRVKPIIPTTPYTFILTAVSTVALRIFNAHIILIVYIPGNLDRTPDDVSSNGNVRLYVGRPQFVVLSALLFFFHI